MQPVPDVPPPESLAPPFPPTVPEVLAHAVASFPEREFLVCGDRRITFRQADEESARLAYGLLALGIGKASRVGILMPNSPDWVLCWLAAARIGALTVPISTLYQASELAWVLAHADVGTLLMVDGYLNHDYVARLETVSGMSGQRSPALVLSGLPYLRHVFVWGETAPAWARQGPGDLIGLGTDDPRLDRSVLEALEAQVAPADDLVVIYTSGSTAEPKAVLHTHAGVVRLTYALQASGWDDVRLGDRMYSAVPFFWIGGLNSGVLPALYRGATLVMSASPAPDDVLDACAAEDITAINAWSPAFRAIAERAAARGMELPHLRPRMAQVDDSGQPIPLELIPNQLGMTETFGPHGLEPRGTRLDPERAGAFGRSLPGIDRKVVDPATGLECPVGEAGELYVRGYSVMRGFYKRLPEDTFDRDGFYPTGDRCRIDADGYLYFEGRFGEMVKTGGANVSPREVEAALERMAAVREAAVFGVPDPDRGEAIVAVVVPADGAVVDPAAVVEGLRSELSHYKVPRLVVPMAYDDIPRAAAGKVKKNALRNLVLARWDELTAEPASPGAGWGPAPAGSGAAVSNPGGW
jgi:acyl-CoA synthetase (AMP-forming)/AMP-acid ligase II